MEPINSRIYCGSRKNVWRRGCRVKGNWRKRVELEVVKGLKFYWLMKPLPSFDISLSPSFSFVKLFPISLPKSDFCLFEFFYFLFLCILRPGLFWDSAHMSTRYSERLKSPFSGATMSSFESWLLNSLCDLQQGT